MSTATDNRPAPNSVNALRNAADVDNIIAVLLDRADADEQAAARNGRTRTAQAAVRRLRYLAHQLGPLGTGDPFDPPAEPRPVEQYPDGTS